MQINKKRVTYLIAAIFIFVGREATMHAAEEQIDNDRLIFARQEIEKYGEHIDAEFQEAILQQKVVLGMDPYEARLAAGAYSYTVQADPSVWPPGADPNRVIAAQSIRPDDSKIRLVFQTRTQFEGGNLFSFAVTFKRGKVEKIEKLN